jgi:Zn-dependent protease
MWIAAAGPISNLILATISIVLINLVWQPMQVGAAMGAAWAEPLQQLLLMSVYINVLLAAFNLIPLYPLDGSWMLSRFLSGGAARAFAALRPYGFIILILLMWSGYLWAYINPFMRVAGMLLPG